MHNLKFSVILIIGLIFLTTSLRAQIEWIGVTDQAVLDYGASSEWDEYAVFNPTVIKDGDTLRMWYSGANDYMLNVSKSIGYAWSIDGINWNKSIDNPVLEADLGWENGSVSAGTVIKDGDSFKMWYEGGNINNKVGYATSVDGIHWSKYPNPVLEAGSSSAWDAAFINPASIIKKNGVYEMWFYAGKLTYILEADFQIGYASSIDGIHWTKYDDSTTISPLYAESDPVLKLGTRLAWDSRRVWHPTVLPTEYGYEVLYTGYNDHHIYDKIGYAYSINGIEWIKWHDNPIISSNLLWGNGITSDAVLKFDNQYQMWFTSYQFTFGMGNYKARIGYATSYPTVYVDSSDIFLNLIDQYKLFQNYPNPFNPTTKINYHIAKQNLVSLKVYDVLGRMVTVLVNEEKPIGVFEVVFDATGLSGGFYFYQLRVGSYSETKKMILIK